MGIWFEKLLDVVYPKLSNCVSCLGDLKHGYICEECKSSISFNKNYDIKKFEMFEALHASYYSGTIKNIIYNFKVNKDFRAGEYLSNILFDYIVNSKIKFDYLSYVPRDRDKIKKEGFDQSYFLCKTLSKKLEIPFLKIIFCTGKKQDQKKMNVKDRSKNVKDKFFVTKNIEKINSKSILIIDDVATTYSTANQVVQVIKKSSFKTKVSVLTIAKTLI